EALGQSVDLIVPPELSAAGLFERVRGGEMIVGLDTQSMTRSGERVDVSISMSPIFDERGEAIGVAGFTRDIGVRVLADERLRRSEMLLTEAQELTSIGSWEWDLITGEIFWSPELFRILGLDPGRVVPCFDAYLGCIHPDDRPAAQRDFAVVATTGTATVRTSRILGSDGVLRITQSRTRATTGADGRVVRLNGTTQDVSEAVHANERLERANRRNEALLNSAGDGIYGIDRDGVTTFANPVAARLTGYAVEHLVGRSRHDTFRHTRSDGSPYAERDCPVSASLADGTVHRCDADVYWRKDGSSFPVEYTSTPIFEQGVVVGAVVVFKDISARRDLEHAKDAFVASISHELRTPLTSIRGYLELVCDEESGPLTDEQRRFLAVVDRNADRLLRVVGSLLLVAQVDAGAVELALDDVDVADLLRQGMEVASPLATANGLELRAELGVTPVLRADRELLGQVVDNLVSNAIKFTPAGGCVTLRCSAVADRVVLEVADTGLGMSEPEQAQLFERFYRTAAADEHAIQGTGLGLTIVKAFVEAHEGTISVTSASDAGTTFRVELPLAGPVHRAAA
ncbi:MAG: hypothetical protein QOE60_2141, partial [Thermoleophilaceae bacterium]|nr:hypothetical protein [Thermoleophilaceae bacterium]